MILFSTKNGKVIRATDFVCFQDIELAKKFLEENPKWKDIGVYAWEVTDKAGEARILTKRERHALGLFD